MTTSHPYAPHKHYTGRDCETIAECYRDTTPNPTQPHSETLQIIVGVSLEAARLLGAVVSVNGLVVLAWLCFGPS